MRRLLVPALMLLSCKREDTKVCPDPVVSRPAPSAAPAPVRTLDVPLPKAAAFGEPVTVLSIAIEADGKIAVNGLAISDDKAITEAAAKAVKADPEVKAVILADRSAKHGRVLEVVDRVRMGGIAKLAFAVAAPTPAP